MVLEDLFHVALAVRRRAHGIAMAPRPPSHATTRKMTAMTANTQPICADMPAMPRNPSTEAIRALTEKTTA